MHKHNDAWGHCPRCNHAGWHKYKGKALIFGEGTTKYKVSIFKCPKCGKKFGFDLSDSSPKPGKISMADILLGRIEEDDDEFEKMLEELSNDYERGFTISSNEVGEIVDRLGKIIHAVEVGNLDPDSAGIILHNATGIREIFCPNKNY